jgi:hypothetical protein
MALGGAQPRATLGAIKFVSSVSQKEITPH